MDGNLFSPLSFSFSFSFCLSVASSAYQSSSQNTDAFHILGVIAGAWGPSLRDPVSTLQSQFRSPTWDPMIPGPSHLNVAGQGRIFTRQAVLPVDHCVGFETYFSPRQHERTTAVYIALCTRG